MKRITMRHLALTISIRMRNINTLSAMSASTSAFYKSRCADMFTKSINLIFDQIQKRYQKSMSTLSTNRK